MRSPAVPIPAIIPRATVVCVWTPITGTIVTADVCGSVVRGGIAAAVIAVTRSAVIAVTGAITLGAGGYATDHRAGNQSAR